MEDELGCNENLPMFKKFAFILNECSTVSEKTPVDSQKSLLESMMSLAEPVPHESEPFISKLGKLLVAKIKAHSREEAELFGPDEILNNKPPSLAPVMYRIATEGFAKESKSIFKVIECRNITKLASDWKPSLPELLNSLDHQVILVELKENLNFQTYNDFVYAVLRQLNYDWKIRLPKSFFYPNDVCEVDASDDYKLILVTPSMPDGEMEFCDRVRNSLQYEILMMLKTSCESAMHNHLLMRDLRVGKLKDAVDGVESIRKVYRTLQERIRSGEEVFLGRNSEDFKLYLSTSAGHTIESASSFLSDCKLLDADDEPSWSKYVSDYSTEGPFDEDEDVIVLKEVDSGSSVESDSSVDISVFGDIYDSIQEEADFNAIDDILSGIKILARFDKDSGTQAEPESQTCYNHDW